MEAELQPRGDPEVAAAAAQGPEEIGVVVGVHAQELTVGGHDVGGEQVVDREAVLAREEADTAGQRDPADPDRARVAEPGREAVRAGRGGVLARGQPGLGPGRASLGIDLECAHRGEIEDDPALGDAVSGGAVATAADGELRPGVASERDDARDVRGVGDADDHGRPAVDRAGEDPPRLVVFSVLRRDDLALEVVGEVGSREHPPRVTALTMRTDTEIRCSRGRLAAPSRSTLGRWRAASALRSTRRR